MLAIDFSYIFIRFLKVSIRLRKLYVNQFWKLIKLNKKGLANRISYRDAESKQSTGSSLRFGGQSKLRKYP